LHLKVAAGGKMLKGLAEKLLVIGDATSQLAGVDIVKLVMIDPILL
jgi:hypothetical protein